MPGVTVVPEPNKPDKSLIEQMQRCEALAEKAYDEMYDSHYPAGPYSDLKDFFLAARGTEADFPVPRVPASMSSNAANESYLLIDELEETLASGSARDRSLMLSRVADLFMHGASRYNAQQISLFDDVLLRLTSEIEMKARAKLAQRLAYMDNAPPRLIRRLAFDDAIDVARPVLTHS